MQDNVTKHFKNGMHGLKQNIHHLELKRKKHHPRFGPKIGMDNNEYIEDFVDSIPDDVWVDLATFHRRDLEKICVALTLDLYFLENEGTSNR